MIMACSEIASRRRRRLRSPTISLTNGQTPSTMIPDTAVADRRAAAKALWADPSLSQAEIGRRGGAPGSTLRGWAVKDGWPPRPPRAKASRNKARPATTDAAVRGSKPAIAANARRDLIDRLYRLVDHNLKDLETQM